MKQLRIGMWSGPRNLSTAMMRAFSSRPDTVVEDEPFYAHFLRTTGENHPGREEVFRELESDWTKVVDHLTGPIPGGRSIWYQKLLTHHLVGEMDLSWTDRLVNCFLIRHPRDVIRSYQKIYPKVEESLLGCRQQCRVFDHVMERTGAPPIVIDADDIASRPEQMLRRLCEELKIEFTDAMLSWPAGPHPSDGVWGNYWYKNVIETTSFHPFTEERDEIDKRHEVVYEQCMACYEKLHQYRCV